MSRQQREQVDAAIRARPPGNHESVEQFRAEFRETMANTLVPGGIRTEETKLGGRRALLVEPAADPGPGTILYFHGGAFVVGSPETALSPTGNLVTRTGFRAFSPDYRLAPEDPYPAAADDALGAYRDLLEQGVDPESIVFAGDSAGGGLSITTCLSARDAGLPLPAAVVVFSAWLDLTGTGESIVTRAAADPMFTPESLAGPAALYLAGQDPRQPLLSPAVSADFTGLPPLLLQVGTNEILLDDSTRAAARAREAGVDVILDVVAGVPHVFPCFTGMLDEADEALDRAGLFLRQRVSARR
ncbi:alpha/beta hydrolase [Amycolatopsis jiangsuensis]|uniref:Acetyl esterase/lipase n=1 Tax=Amycolatopsis jiangsuensis TaxID=1181879 RepID=A0A840J6G3_9PSEU|nr:alpha/beta hydrolase [Amycolatopsis jiangsuensis]MBB4689022.1 acetyl esterase/lipase [Amycolatopsis jiangsuensis]